MVPEVARIRLPRSARRHGRPVRTTILLGADLLDRTIATGIETGPADRPRLLGVSGVRAR